MRKGGFLLPSISVDSILGQTHRQCLGDSQGGAEIQGGQLAIAAMHEFLSRHSRASWLLSQA